MSAACQKIVNSRSGAASLPRVVVSLNSVPALEWRANDYRPKPASARGLLGLALAALWWTVRTSTREVVTLAGSSLDFTKTEVLRDGQLIGPTGQECKTLKFLAQNPERVISRD